MPRLIALTEPARRSLRGDFVVLNKMPFRIGRESRRTGSTGMRPDEKDRRQEAATPLNDLFIAEADEGSHVSREHVQIEIDDGEYFVRDRGSLNGIIVEGRSIGGDRAGGRAHLQDHHVIIIGTATSPFAFKFRTI
jgi:pSer/pThr/pTyr-binding forkhead associated (FHA) protein